MTATARPSLRQSLVVTWVLCLTGVVAALAALALAWSVEQQLAQRRAQADLALVLAAELLPVATDQGRDILAIDGFLHRMQRAGPFMDLAYASATLNMTFDTRLLEPTIPAAPAAIEGARPVWRRDGSRDAVAQAVRARGAVLGVLSGHLLASDRAALALATARRGAVPVLAVLALGLGFGIAAAMRGTRPLEQAARACERVAKGILSPPKVEPEGLEGARLTVALRQIVATLRQNADRIDTLVTRDPLTLLANRATFAREAGVMLAGLAARHAPGALILIDLTGLRAVNERHGEDAGDQVLRVVARRLADGVAGSTLLANRPATRTDRDGAARPLTDLVGRLGWAEFAVVLHNAGVAADVAQVAEMIQGLVARPIRVDDGEVTLTARLGVAIKRGATLDYPSLRRAAGAALIEARVSGQALVFADHIDGGALRHVPSQALAG